MRGTKRQVHPFPARMAPDLALRALTNSRKGDIVLDPMCGSGTVIQHALRQGCRAVGLDADPLAVLMTQVGCRRLDNASFQKVASSVVAAARSMGDPSLPWMDDDAETSDFATFWFGESQRQQLRRLAAVLQPMNGKRADALRLALSRTIITKDAGASLARDVSHSRPHRVRVDNDFDVYAGFVRAAASIGHFCSDLPQEKVWVSQGDARALPSSLDSRVNLIVTSPPYLNAIDYMRGHRLSLVWLGHRLSELRSIRSNSIGSERGPELAADVVRQIVPVYEQLAKRQQAMLDRYGLDILAMARTMSRALVVGGEAVLVVGDCNIRGALVRNSDVVANAANFVGLSLADRQTRQLPAGSRYLPPPGSTQSALQGRMKEETVFRFVRTNEEDVPAA